MYSPKIKEDLIPKIYQKAKAQGITMTSLVDKIIRKALNDDKLKVKEGEEKWERKLNG